MGRRPVRESGCVAITTTPRTIAGTKPAEVRMRCIREEVIDLIANLVNSGALNRTTAVPPLLHGENHRKNALLFLIFLIEGLPCRFDQSHPVAASTHL